MEANATPVIDVKNLVRRFRRSEALRGVDLEVPEGCVYGLVGENGAGKTTLLNHILGALKPQQGTVRVFGRDPVKEPVAVLRDVGYLSEQREIPGWMRLRDLMRYTQSFYPKWDPGYADNLADTFGLDKGERVSNLSRGQTALAGLLIALAHRPKLVVLDEPSSGLDPIVRREILAAIIRTVADEGRTILFSSHLLDEVERVADRVTMLAQGRVVLTEDLDSLKENHHRLVIRFATPQDRAPVLEGALSVTGAREEWTVLCNGNRERVLASVQRLEATVVAETAPDLEEIFVARVKHSKQGR